MIQYLHNVAIKQIILGGITMTTREEREERDLKEVIRLEDELRRKIKEAYPEEIPFDLFSPCTASWLAQRVVSMRRIEQVLGNSDDKALRFEVEAMQKRDEVLQLWHECYLLQNS